jgi:hypothetical protein
VTVTTNSVILGMTVKLIQQIPKQDGYYLVKFSETGGLHLVLVQTEIDGKRVIFPDIFPFKNSRLKKTLKCLSEPYRLNFHEFPVLAWWSEPISIGE